MIRKKWKGIVAAVLCGGMMMGMQPVRVQAAEAQSMIQVATEATVHMGESREVLRLVNEARAQKGANPLIMSKELEQAAIDRGFELITYMAHVRPNGYMFSNILKDYGVTVAPFPKGELSENIAIGYSDPQSVVEGWRDSEAHWSNIVNKRFTYIGISSVEYQGERYWVQIFAKNPTNVTEAPAEGSNEITETRDFPLDTNSGYRKAKLAFKEEQVKAKPGEDLAFDLEFWAPYYFNDEMRKTGDVLFSSLQEENIILPEKAPFTVDQSGIHVAPDAEPGTYQLEIQAGRRSAVKTILISDCEHPEDKLITEEKAPTCTEKGYRKVTCQECGRVITEEELDLIPHQKSEEWEILQGATCFQDGKRVRKCTMCGLVMEEEVISHTENHDFTGKETVVKEATCTEEGKKTVACSTLGCGAVKEEVIPATGHKPGEWEITEEATCEKDGEKVQKCTACQTVLGTEMIPAAGHKWSEWIVEKEPQWDEAGLQKRTCQSCGEAETLTLPPLSESHTHDFGGAVTIIKEATCTEEGRKTIACTNPSCDKVKEEVIPATGHKPGEWEVAEKATCEKGGKKVQKCTVCQTVLKTETIKATGHSWSEWAVEKEPQWDEAGLQKRTCTVCQKSEERVIPPLSEIHEHNFTGVETILKEATCTEEGKKTIACTEENCGEVKEEVIPAVGHRAGEWETTKEADCTEEGERIQKCTVCQEVVNVESVEALGHTWSDWTVEKEADTDTEGLKRRTCETCGETEEETIPKFPAKPQEPDIPDNSDGSGEEPEAVKPVVPTPGGNQSGGGQVGGTSGTAPQSTTGNDVVKTGVNSGASFWQVMAAGSAAAGILLIIFRKKYKKTNA